MQKKDLKGFIMKCIIWASNFEDVTKEQLNEFEVYLFSDDFFELVKQEAENTATQEDFNKNITFLVLNKIGDFVHETECFKELQEILNSNNISTKLWKG